MKKNYYKSLALALGLAGSVYAQQPEWTWAKSSQFNQGAAITTMAVDQGGNLYSGGILNPGHIAFDGQTAVNANMGTNFFIVKHDADGNAQWINKASSQQCYLRNITTDAEGNVYGVGYFMHNITLGELTESSPSVWSMVLFRLDSNGNYTWARHFGESHRVTANKIVADAEGNIYVAGSFSCPNVNFDDFSLTLNGVQNAFVAKFDNHGNVVWAKNAGVAGLSSADALTIDDNANVYISGHFGGTLALGGNTYNNAGAYDCYIAKFNAQGVVTWVRTFGGSDHESPDNMIADEEGNIIISGEFYSHAIAIGSTILTNTGESSEIFLAKFDNHGALSWGKVLHGAGQDNISAITLDPDNNLIITGSFESPSLDIAGTLLQNTEGDHIFLASLRPDGALRWAEYTGGTGNNGTGGLVVDNNNNIYIAGKYSNSISFGDTILNTGVNSMAFIAKFAQGVLGNDAPIMDEIGIYPNPAKDVLYLKSAFGYETYTIFDITGKIIQSGLVENNSISINALANGLYVLSLPDGATAKFIKE